MARIKGTFIDTHVYLEVEQHERITAISKKQRRKFAEQLRLIVDEYLERVDGHSLVRAPRPGTKQ